MQLVRIIDNSTGPRDYQKIGPLFKTEAALRNYVETVIPASQWWEMAVWVYTDDEVYGGQQLAEAYDLQEWLAGKW